MDEGMREGAESRGKGESDFVFERMREEEEEELLSGEAMTRGR